MQEILGFYGTGSFVTVFGLYSVPDKTNTEFYALLI